MKKNLKFQVGDRVRVQVEKPMWYSSYGLCPEYTIQVGEMGVVVATGIPPVRGPRTTDMIKVSFGYLLLPNSTQSMNIENSYFPDELKLVD